MKPLYTGVAEKSTGVDIARSYLYSVSMADERTLQDLIYETLERRNWSGAELAEAAKLSPGTISHILNEKRRPTPDTLRKLAPALGVTEDHLFELVGHKASQQRGRPPSRDELLDQLLAVDAVEVEYYEMVEASASSLRHILAQDPSDYRYLPTRKRFPKGRIKGIKVRGNCMAPLLSDGDDVFVDTRAALEEGQIVLALVDDCLHVKRLRAVGDGWELAPDNGDPAIPVTDGVHIIGRVIGSWRPLI